jgi:Ca2+-binding EF-hand superfamily protein
MDWTNVLAMDRANNLNETDMRNSLCLIIGALASVAGCATVQNTYERTPFASAFSGFDKNDDGVISRQEAQVYSPLANNFSRIDTNGSAGIDTNEYTAATSQVASINFQEVDANGDGVISKREADGMPFSLKEIYGDVDADRDSNVSTVEYQAASVNLLRGMSFESIDWDGDGIISTNEASELPVLAEAYDRVDTDDDGLISRKEYAAAQRCC